MSRELIAVIDQIGREKGIDKAKVIGAVEAALQTAAKKRFGQSENIQVQIDQKINQAAARPRATRGCLTSNRVRNPHRRPRKPVHPRRRRSPHNPAFRSRTPPINSPAVTSRARSS